MGRSRQYNLLNNWIVNEVGPSVQGSSWDCWGVRDFLGDRLQTCEGLGLEFKTPLSFKPPKCIPSCGIGKFKTVYKGMV